MAAASLIRHVSETHWTKENPKTDGWEREKGNQSWPLSLRNLRQSSRVSWEMSSSVSWVRGLSRIDRTDVMPAATSIRSPQIRPWGCAIAGGSSAGSTPGPFYCGGKREEEQEEEEEDPAAESGAVRPSIGNGECRRRWRRTGGGRESEWERVTEEQREKGWGERKDAP